MTITVDLLHPALALRLLPRARGRRVRWFLRAGGWAGWLAEALLRRAGATVEEWSPTLADPVAVNPWHRIQQDLATAGRALGAHLDAALSGGPEPCRARLVRLLQNQLLTELATGVGVAAMLRDAAPGDELWLLATRAETLVDAPWRLPGDVALHRHSTPIPLGVARKPGYYLGGGQAQTVVRSTLAGLVGGALLALVGTVMGLVGRGPALGRHPFAVFLLPNEVGRVLTGFGWLKEAGLAPLGVVPATRPDARAKTGIPFAATLGWGFGRDLFSTRAADWRGYGRALLRLWRDRVRADLPAALGPWYRRNRLDLMRREAFFLAAFERTDTRLVWLMAQFEALNSSAVASAVLRRGGDCWGACNSLLDALDSFAFRANAARVVTWGRRDAALYAASGSIERVEALGYPDPLDDYRARGAALRDALRAEGFTRVVALYDNNFGADLMITIADYAALFQAARRVLDAAPGTALIVKAKDETILARGLGADLDRWKSDPCVRFDWERSNLAPAFAADVVMGIMLSSPGCLAAAEGIPVFSLDPAGYAEHAAPVGAPAYTYYTGAEALAEAVLAAPERSEPVDTDVVARVSDAPRRLAAGVREALGA